jgi:hypothetical protein
MKNKAKINNYKTIEIFIEELKRKKDFCRQIVHHEVIPSRQASYANPSPPTTSLSERWTKEVRNRKNV